MSTVAELELKSYDKLEIPYFFDQDGEPTPPSPVQVDFHSSTAKFRLYSGAYGAGKTLAGCQEAVQLCLFKYPGINGAICRLTYPELRMTTRKTFFEVIKVYENALGFEIGDRSFGLSDGIAGFLKSENTYRFAPDLGGSEVLFLHLDDYQKLGSLNLGFWYLDEGTELNEDVYRMLVGRLRQSDVPWRGGYVTTNPADFLNWVYRYFIENAAEDHEVFHTTTYDNIYLPEDYIKGMESTFDDDYKRRYLLGEWGTFEGLVYKGFNRELMIEEFEPPKDLRGDYVWDFRGGQDLGIRNPSVMLDIGWDGEVIYIVDEYYVTEVASDEFIEEVHRHFDKYGHSRIDGDPSAKDTIVRQRNEGLPVVEANNAVEDGIRTVKEFVQVVNGKPLMKIHPRCIHTIREFGSYKYPKVKGLISYDKPMKENDHAMDALRYAVMAIKEGGMWLGK